MPNGLLHQRSNHHASVLVGQPERDQIGQHVAIDFATVDLVSLPYGLLSLGLGALIGSPLALPLGSGLGGVCDTLFFGEASGFGFLGIGYGALLSILFFIILNRCQPRRNALATFIVERFGFLRELLEVASDLRHAI